MEATLQGFGALSRDTGRRRTANKRRPPAKRRNAGSSSGGGGSSTPQTVEQKPAGYVNSGDTFVYRAHVHVNELAGIITGTAADYQKRIFNRLDASQKYDSLSVLIDRTSYSFQVVVGGITISGSSRIDRNNIDDIRAEINSEIQTYGGMRVTEAQIDFVNRRSARQNPYQTSPASGGSNNYSQFGNPNPSPNPSSNTPDIFKSIKDEFATASLGALAVTVGLLFVVFKK